MKRFCLMLFAALLALMLLACDPQSGDDPAQTSGEDGSETVGSWESGDPKQSQTDGETEFRFETTEGGGVELPDIPL